MKVIKKALLIILFILLILAIAFFAYRASKTKLLDKSAYTELSDRLEEDSLNFRSQEDLMQYICRWADSNKLEYTEDESGNIIFDRPASEDKKHVTPTVVLASCNYETAAANKKMLASAAMVAMTPLESGRCTVIFVNNIDNNGEAYKKIDEDYFSKNAKVIYLDYGKNYYVSTSSFARSEQTIMVPSEKDSIGCDTAVRVHISGLTSNYIDTNIGAHPNPIEMFSTILTRLKSKSTKYQISDINVGNRDNMYPESIDFTVLLNSYSVSSFTSYLDKRIEAFNDAYEETYLNASYSYEVIDDFTELPDKAYSSETADALTTLLYTLKNGGYRLDEDDVLPEGYSAGDLYAINCVKQLRIDDEGQIFIDVSSQAIDDKYLDSILNENAACAAISNCTIEESEHFAAFRNFKNSLNTTLRRTYIKVADLSGTYMVLPVSADTYFTPMTYLNDINKNMDIVHLKESSKTASVLTNVLLCYIQTKGNFLSL